MIVGNEWWKFGKIDLICRIGPVVRFNESEVVCSKSKLRGETMPRRVEE
jgi:hypothetical protein